MELLNLKITELETKINTLKLEKNVLKNERDALLKQHQQHLIKHTCLSKWNTNALYFNKASSTRRRLKMQMSELFTKIDEHNLNLGLF